MDQPTTLVIASCRRPEKLCLMLDSFVRCCMDLDLISRVVVSDDNSETGQIVQIIEKVKACFPCVPIVFKHRINERGSAYTWAHGWAEVKTPFLFHAEDDWEYTEPEHHIRYAQRIMRQDEKIAEVAFSYSAPGSHYLDGFLDRLGTPVIAGGDHYILWPVWDGVNSAWPGFTCNPCVVHLARLRQANLDGPNIMPGSEYNFGARYAAAGFRIAFKPKIVVRHTGTVRAYELNDSCV